MGLFNIRNSCALGLTRVARWISMNETDQSRGWPNKGYNMNTVHILVSVEGYGINGRVALDTDHTQSEWDALDEGGREDVAREAYAENITWGWSVATPDEIEHWS